MMRTVSAYVSGEMVAILDSPILERWVSTGAVILRGFRAAPLRADEDRLFTGVPV